jgi:hypothetical protein
MKTLYQNILKGLLPVLFISYLAGVTLFIHPHVVNGVTIVHSHPFNKNAEHSHTTTEFQLIHLLSQVLIAGALFFPLLLAAYAVVLCTLFDKPESPGYTSSFRGVLSLRAPPSMAEI